MYPPVGIGQIRVAEKHDIVLGGKLHLPAGTIMWVSAGLSTSGPATADWTVQELLYKGSFPGLKDSRDVPWVGHWHGALAQQCWIPCAGAPSCHPERLLQLG